MKNSQDSADGLRCAGIGYELCLIMSKYSIYRHFHIHELSDPSFFTPHLGPAYFINKNWDPGFFSSRLLFTQFEPRGIKMVDDGVAGPAYPSGTSGRHSQFLMRIYIALALYFVLFYCH
jgi:hypothetical protein